MIPVGLVEFDQTIDVTAIIEIVRQNGTQKLQFPDTKLFAKPDNLLRMWFKIEHNGIIAQNL